jgi:sortase A
MRTSEEMSVGASRGRPAARHRPGAVLRWIGIVALVLASGIAGYLTWILWGTGLETARAQEALRSTFERQIDSEPADSRSAQSPVLIGHAIAEIVIPAINLDFVVVQGTGTEALQEGPGHYVETAMPWDRTGRVAIAGHRTTYLHPFQNLDDLRAGDEIDLRTRYGTFRYGVTRVFAIASAGSGRVLAQTTPPDLVLTTCHPEFSSAERLIVYADRRT